MRDFICINPNVFEKKYPSTRAGGKPGISSLRLYKFETLSGAGTVAEMSETKTPQAGEYWLSGISLIAYVVGFTIDGDPAWQQKGSRQILSDEMQFFLACFHHEPRCDSFDWVEPEQAEWSDMAAIQNMDLSDKPVYTTIDVNPGDGYRWLGPEEFIEATDEVFRPDLNPMWLKPLTRAGYMCCDDDYPVRRRIEPVESPDDWVEITDTHPGHSRRLCDEVCGKTEEPDDWHSVTKATVSMSQHAYPMSRIRCRRKDLPVPMTLQLVAEVCTSEPKRVPVRLWVHREASLNDRCNVFAKTTEPDDRDLYLEILLDDDGFHVENPSG